MNKLYISMYHYTRDLHHSRYPQMKGMDVSLLRQQFEFYKHKFNVVRMEQVIDTVKTGAKLPQKALLLTFDDGYIDNYTFAMPLLEEFGFQGSFFIPGKTFTTHQLLDVNKIHYIIASAEKVENLVIDVKERINYYRGVDYNVESADDLWKKYAVASRFDDAGTVFVKRVLQTALPKKFRKLISSDLFKKYVGISEEQLAYELYLTEDQIRTMRRHGMFIGIHGYDHYWLGNLSEAEMRNDIDSALKTLNDFIDINSWVMNFPYGSYNQNVLNYIKKKGACIGLTTEVQVARLGENNPLMLPRLDCNDFPPKSERYKEF